MKFQIVKNLYANGTGPWKIVHVRQAVVSGWITEAEFLEITGQPYV
ncbi:MAG: XkdX family protein [Sphaerochaetaceae bacterium]